MMIDTKGFIDALVGKGADLFAGVPDSLLKEFSGRLMQMDGVRHVVTANEGNAVGLAIGHYLATGRPGVVYMQNSGLGNVVNPVASLADPDVYAVPVLLIVGWRGEPGVRDEPQHVKQGRITPAQLDVLGIPYRILDVDTDAGRALDEVWDLMLRRGGPAALIVRKGAFGPVGYAPAEAPEGWPDGVPPLYRERAVERVLDLVPEDGCVVATTGKTGREVFELRAAAGRPQRDFLTVGGMGHASSIALGIAMAQPSRPVVCLDGDGAVLMHMGALAVAGTSGCANLIHVLLNNQSHESVGGQPTVAGRIDFRAVSLACGYADYAVAWTPGGIEAAMRPALATPGPHFVEIRLWHGARADLGRPTSAPARNKDAVMRHLGAS